MASAWLSAWASAWGSSWGAITGAGSQSDTHDGGYGSADLIRKRLRKAKAAHLLSARKRRQAERRLTDELELAYRRIVLGEPEIALEVARTVAEAPLEMTEAPATLDMSRLASVLDTAQAIIGILERERFAAQDEDDVEVLLLAGI